MRKNLQHLTPVAACAMDDEGGALHIGGMIIKSGPMPSKSSGRTLARREQRQREGHAEAFSGARHQQQQPSESSSLSSSLDDELQDYMDNLQVPFTRVMATASGLANFWSILNCHQIEEDALSLYRIATVSGVATCERHGMDCTIWVRPGMRDQCRIVSLCDAGRRQRQFWGGDLRAFRGQGLWEQPPDGPGLPA